ncbi:tyrosine phosphatase family-domain-containing protein [Xylaria sp. FL0064]|nr:tyrosine phosphatase family-domain-containing protein [Xylaria sp. FL0064]
MGDSSLVSGQPQVPDVFCEVKPQPGMHGSYTKRASQPIEAASSRNPSVKNVSQESQTCTGRAIRGHVMPIIYQPPVNFATVAEGLYRSGYPETADYPFIQGLKLKTIVTLVNKELPDGYQEFIQENQITHRIFDMAGTKKEDIPIEMMRSIYAVVSDRKNYPLLIHCNHGKHRTGCVVGVLRKSNQWSLKRILDEYTTFAEPKIRDGDIKYLTDFELATLLRQPREGGLPPIFGRHFKVAVLMILAFLTLYPLSQFKNQEPCPRET